MEEAQEFIDFYDLLKVDPACDPRTLETAYHYFAKRYHPDNLDTADVDRFQDVVRAYKTLRSVDGRAHYDQQYTQHVGEIYRGGAAPAGSVFDELTAINDERLHASVLQLLYKKRRESPMDAGLVGWILQEKLGCSEASFEFLAWYLKAKGLVSIDEQGKYAITVEGVDHVISMSKRQVEETLLISQFQRESAAGELEEG